LRHLVQREESWSCTSTFSEIAQPNLNGPTNAYGSLRIVEPIVFRLKTDEHAGRLAVARDDDFLFLG
jgi:protein-arginine kinase activator protein McsA